TAPWTHLPMVAARFADFTWRHARLLTAQAGRDATNQTEIARVLDELLTRAQAGPPADKATARVAARTRVAAAAHCPPPREKPAAVTSGSDEDAGSGQLAAVIPFGVFDADAEASRW